MNLFQLGAWYNGSIGVSKTFDGSSILSAPAKCKYSPKMDLKYTIKHGIIRKIRVFFVAMKKV